MKVSKIAILALRGTEKESKERLAAALGASANSVYRWINENEDNGELTKATAVKVIAEETGLKEEEILEESDVVKESQN
jgi:transposase-like protein